MIALLVIGIGVFVAGLVTAAFGIPVKEFSFGNTLILSGAVVACTGLIMISLSLVVRELRVIAQRLRSGSPAADRDRDLQLSTAPVPELAKETDDGRLPPLRSDQSGPDRGDPGATPSIPSSPPWQSAMATRDRGAGRIADAARDPAAPESSPSVAAVTPPPKSPRRNLLFSSSLRKDRERAAAGPSDPMSGTPPVPPAAAPDPDMSPPPSFDEAWPRPERSRTEQSRPSSMALSAPPRLDRPSDVRGQTAPAVTVLKSGVVDGMAYSLYSDGSIEAQMPEGMMRFASIDELRTHLDQRT